MSARAGASAPVHQITADRRLIVTASDLLADGSTFDVDFVVTDEDGAHTDVTWTFPVDASVVIPNVRPSVTIHTTDRTVNGGEVVDLSATASDPDGTIASLDWSGAGTFVDDEIADARWTAPAAASDTRSYTLTLTATDNDGDTDTDTVTFRVRGTGIDIPVEVTIHTNDRTVAGGATVNLSATVDGPDGTTQEWTAAAGTFGDDSDEDTTWAAPAQTDAEQVIVLTLTGEHGSDSDSDTVTITIPGIVAAVLEWDPSGAAKHSRRSGRHVHAGPGRLHHQHDRRPAGHHGLGG